MSSLSEQDVSSVVANSERGEQAGFTTSFENTLDRNNIFHGYNLTDETQGYSPDKASEFLVPRTRFDRQSHTNHGTFLTFGFP